MGSGPTGADRRSVDPRDVVFPLTSPLRSEGNTHQSGFITQGPNLGINQHTTDREEKWAPWNPLRTKLDCQYGPSDVGDEEKKQWGRK